MVNINAKYNARWKSRSVEAAETGDGPRPEVAVGTGGGTRLVMEISGCSGRLSRRRRRGLADRVRWPLTPRHVFTATRTVADASFRYIISFYIISRPRDILILLHHHPRDIIFLFLLSSVTSPPRHSPHRGYLPAPHPRSSRIRTGLLLLLNLKVTLFCLKLFILLSLHHSSSYSVY